LFKAFEGTGSRVFAETYQYEPQHDSKNKEIKFYVVILENNFFRGIVTLFKNSFDIKCYSYIDLL